MIKNVIAVHGFNDKSSGKGTTLRLKPYFVKEGYNFTQHEYGWLGVLGVYLFDDNLAKKLADSITEPTILIGHSNGCAIAHLASFLNPLIKHIVYINPALNNDAVCACTVDNIDVWHSPSDIPVRVARWLPWCIWGNMGSKGFTGTDGRYTNYNKEEDFGVVSNAHSDVFTPILLDFYAPLIIKKIKEKTK